MEKLYIFHSEHMKPRTTKDCFEKTLLSAKADIKAEIWEGRRHPWPLRRQASSLASLAILSKCKDTALPLAKSFCPGIWWCYFHSQGRRTQEACHREALALCLSLLFSPPRTGLMLASSLLLAPSDSFCTIPREVIFFITLLIHDEKSQRNFWKAGT